MKKLNNKRPAKSKSDGSVNSVPIKDRHSSAVTVIYIFIDLWTNKYLKS
jgi:hypothetical protein